jgi:hypothetical protein
MFLLSKLKSPFKKNYHSLSLISSSFLRILVANRKPKMVLSLLKSPRTTFWKIILVIFSINT